MRVECFFVRDALLGGDCFELRLRLVEMMTDEYPFKDDD